MAIGDGKVPAGKSLGRDRGFAAAPSAPVPGAAKPLSELAMTLPVLRLAMGLLSATLIFAGLYLGRDILVPLALAALLGFVLYPGVTLLRRTGMPRILAVVVVVGLALGTVAVAGALLATQVRDLSADLPTYQTTIQNKVREFRKRLEKPGMLDGAVKTIDIFQKEVDENAPADAAPGRSTPEQVQIIDTPSSPMAKASQWLSAVSGPLASAGIVLVFLFLVLIDRQELRDRLLRLFGGNLHRTTDAMKEAGTRISKYLIMQLVVNASYGVPMAIGLWFIGIPGAALWGALAAVMRFIPYLGPMISAVFPIVLAFAVDPGWSMLLWTIGLIVVLEVISNNIVEPWLYGSSTGLSALSLIVSATVWTALWGPIGLVMSTPLTVCLLVIGRHLPYLNFLDVLLGSQPALDPPTRLYQRLLAGDVVEALELATARVEADGAEAFYHHVAIPALRLASGDHDQVSSVEHRHRIVSGMDRVVGETLELKPAPASNGRPAVVCLGGKWEVDTIAARMVAHGLALAGIAAEYRDPDVTNADSMATLDLQGASMVCLSHFSPEPQAQVRYLCRKLRRRWPKLHIILAAWNAPPELLDATAYRELGANTVTISYNETILSVSQHFGATLATEYLPAPLAAEDVERVRALRASGAFDERVRRHFDQAAKRAADIFDVPLAMVTLIDEDTQQVCGSAGGLGSAPGVGGAKAFEMPRPLSMCGHVVASGETMVVEDIARDPRFANNPALLANGLRFYAGAPFGDAAGHVFGSLCLMDTKPRTLTAREIKLLGTLASDLSAALQLESSVAPTSPVADITA